MLRLLIGTIVTVCLVASAPAQVRKVEELVKAELLADVSAVEPGKPFTLAVLFKIEPGWHIYWTNPGDSGEATKVAFEVPEGFTVGELQFPIPRRFTQPGDIVGYGYEREVMLLATVTPPREMKSGRSITLRARPSWLVCEQVCIPGEATLELKLPVGPANASPSAAQFRGWRGLLPQAPSKVAVEVRQTFSYDDHLLKIDIKWREKAPERAEWFPPALDDVSFNDIKLNSTGQNTTVRVKVSPLARKPIERKVVESVLAYDGPDELGGRTAIRLNFVPGPSDGMMIPQN
jgi:DsbC/DsbD-like thiol-disulfide interchange protein